VSAEEAAGAAREAVGARTAAEAEAILRRHLEGAFGAAPFLDDGLLGSHEGDSFPDSVSL
jgi:hypothetical protein